MLESPSLQSYTSGISHGVQPVGFRSSRQGNGAVNIHVNDEHRSVAAGTTVAQLLELMQMPRQYVAVECNLELVPRAAHGECVLAEGDRLEIVTLVGGG